MKPLERLMRGYAQPGRINQIWRRSARLLDPSCVATARLQDAGIEGDHARAGKRALTLIQAEHLPAIAAYLGRETVDPALLRRNVVVSGLNLSALRGRALELGSTAKIEITGPCAPCSRMETALGTGGYAALRGHGGWCATVLVEGQISVGDHVTPI